MVAAVILPKDRPLKRPLLLAALAALAASIRATLFLGRGVSWAMALLTLPVYWLMISIATWIAVLQFFAKKRRWIRTAHGVSRIKPQMTAAAEAKPVPAPKPAAAPREFERDRPADAARGAGDEGDAIGERGHGGEPARKRNCRGF